MSASDTRRVRIGDGGPHRRIGRRGQRYGALALLASLALVSPATAGAQPSAVPGEGEVRALLDWIGSASGRDVADVREALPRIVVVEPDEGVDFDGQTLHIDPAMSGLWDTEYRLIVLFEPWRASDPVDLSVLLHELVHAVQAESGGSVCEPDAEREAYALQARWLAERGIVMMIDWGEVERRSLCPADTRP